jgi:peroxiredoxin (alkyl hydroperoxide reductase subunit C)
MTGRPLRSCVAGRFGYGINAMPTLVGKPAPIFNANAVVNGEVVSDFSLTRYLDKQHVVFFFYPKDFTFVCPSELHAFQAALAEFQSRDTAVVACSTDTEQSHWGWLQVPKDRGGIQGVTYPIVADTNKTISSAFGVLAGELHAGASPDAPFTATGELIAYRGLFLIDRQGKVRHALVNDLPLGRNVDEALRMVDALQFFEQHGEVCPANWARGKPGMKATSAGVAAYLSHH